MDPVAFTLGAVQIRWYGILLAFSFFLGYLIFKKQALEKKFSEKFVDDFFLYLIPFSIIGSRLVEVVVYDPVYYFSDPIKIFYVWQGGLASHGGILGALVAVYLVSKKHTISFYKVADLLPIPFFLSAGIGRIGNFINGEIVGKVSSLPWAVSFAGYSGLRHPVQLYEMVMDFILFGIFLKLKSKNFPEGCFFYLALGMYSLFRFIVEFYKEMPLYFHLTIGQWLSIFLMLVSLVMFFRRKNLKKDMA